MQLPCSEELNIEYLGRLFDNTSECYKFFWFKAIVAATALWFWSRDALLKGEVMMS